MHRLLLGGDYSMIADINNANQMTGSSGITGSLNSRHAFVLTGATAVDYGTLGGTTSDAFAINASGTICGGAWHAFIWSATRGLVDLNNQLLAGSGWTLTEARALNDSGQIVGTGTHLSQQHAFLLTPLRFHP